LDALGGNGYECGRLMPLPKPVQPIRPRNERGEFVDRQGELRAEIRRLLDDPTVAASSLRERARTDAEFGRALDAELRPAGPAPAKANDKQIEQELRSFMWAYNHTADLKFYGGYSTLRYQDGTTKQFTREERDRKVNFAASLGIH
jgi:hypothetical protein